MGTMRADGSLVVDVGLPTRIVVPAGGPRRPQEDPKDDGYPDIIIDIPRGYVGFDKPADEATIEDVFAYWDDQLDRRNLVGMLGPAPVVPYINQSRWVADCVCNGGMLCWPQVPYAACLSCGRLYAVRWQMPAERSAVIRVLAARPADARNWDPRRVDKAGDTIETVEFLRRENMLMLGHQ